MIKVTLLHLAVWLAWQTGKRGFLENEIMGIFSRREFEKQKPPRQNAGKHFEDPCELYFTFEQKITFNMAFDVVVKKIIFL